MNDKNVGFRVDSSFKIGQGHITRCQTLADELKKNGFRCYFFCRHINLEMKEMLIRKGHHVNLINNGDVGKDQKNNLYASWLGCSQESDFKEFAKKNNLRFQLFLIDHYSLDIRWEKMVKNHTEKLVVIDDLASRKHGCDYLINYNPITSLENHYRYSLNYNSHLLLGPQYAILKPEFSKLRPHILRKGNLRNILVFYGGSDPTRETFKVVRVLEKYFKSKCFWKRIFIVVGSMNKDADKISLFCKKIPRTFFYTNIASMAELIKNSDVALCSGGIFTWERFCLGLPGYVTTIAENQIKAILDLASKGLVRYVGYYEDIKEQTIKEILLQIKNIEFSELGEIKKMMELVDGEGAKRVVNTILK